MSQLSPPSFLVGSKGTLALCLHAAATAAMCTAARPFALPLPQISLLDEVVRVSSRDAVDTARGLALEEGLLVGISSGVAPAALWAALFGPGQQLTSMCVALCLSATVFPEQGRQ